MPSAGEGAPAVATVRNTFIHLPDIPVEDSDDSDDACPKQRFRTCPALEGRASPSASPSPRNLDGEAAPGTAAAALPPVLLGRAAQPEEPEPTRKAALLLDGRKVVVKNSFIHAEVASPWDDWDLSPGPGFGRARPTTCPSFDCEKRWPDDEETVEDEVDVGAVPVPARLARGGYSTMDLQEAFADDCWFPGISSPISSAAVHLQAEAGPRLASGPRPGEAEQLAGPGSLTLAEAVQKAQEAADMFEAASNEPAQQSQQGAGSPHLGLSGALLNACPQAEQLMMFPSTSPMTWAHMPLSACGAPVPQVMAPCSAYWPFGFPIAAATSPVATSTAASPALGSLSAPSAAAAAAGPAAPCGCRPPVLELAPLTTEAASTGASPAARRGAAGTTCAAAVTPPGGRLPVLELASLMGPPAQPPPRPEPLLSSALLQVESEKAPSAQAGAGNRRQGGRRLRLWAHIYLHMQDVPGFDLVPRLIGRRGCNMRRIAEETGAKIRIRGRGSGHLEVDGKSEAPTPLMVAVTTDHQDGKGFQAAIVETVKVLKAVEVRFRAHCDQQRWVHEGPCYSLGIVPPAAREILGAVLDEIPQLDPTASSTGASRAQVP